MMFRYVDRPVQFFKDENGLDKEFSGYLWQMKADGWCTEIVRDKSKKIVEPWGRADWGKGKDGSLFFLSRRPMNKGGPTQMPVDDRIIQVVESWDLPDQSALAAEWMARRNVVQAPEMFYLFDVLWWNDKWMGFERLEDRIKTLGELTVKTKKGVVEVMPSGVEHFDAVFAMIKKDPEYSWTEGLVLKHLGSKLKGDHQKGVDNGLHIKNKWRAGYDRREEL
jgi:hypothetical protein